MSQIAGASGRTPKRSSTLNPSSLRVAQGIARSVGRFLLSHPFVGSDFLRLRIGERFIPSARDPAVVRTVLGCRVEVDPMADETVELGIYRYGIYEAGTIRVLRGCLRPEDVFVDIGASVGLMSLVASRLVGPRGRVFAFEPQEASFAFLTRNLVRNGAANVTPLRLAVGSTKGTLPLYARPRARGMATMVPGRDDGDPSAIVEVTAIDDFVREQGIDRCRMLKVDVEGMDLEVLRGAQGLLSRPGAPIICIEYSHGHPIAGGVPLDIYQTLTKVNEYRVFRLTRGKDYGSRLLEVLAPEQLPTHDNLFCFLPSHLPSVRSSIFARPP